MIPTILRIAWTTLRRDRVDQALTFLLPVIFFSIFALVFGGQGRGVTSRIPVAVVDEGGSALNKRLVAALSREKGLRVRVAARPKGAPRDAAEVPLDRARAEEMVRDGDVPVALILPRGLAISFAGIAGGVEDDAIAPGEEDATGRAEGDAGAGARSILLLADVSDPIAPEVVSGLLQKVTMTAAPDLLMKDGIGQFERYAGMLTPEQRRAVEAWLPELEALAEKQAGDGKAAAGDTGRAPAGGDEDAAAAADTAGSAAAGGAFGGIVPVTVVDVLGKERERPLISFYAAGIGVMFLLFTCVGTGGSLLEEIEAGTFERLLTSRLGMGRLLLGKWLYSVLLGALELVVMFVWGAVVFGLDLAGHLVGFALMTIATSAAAAGFGLVLATAARTRAQLSGFSTILILTMSALGGSMFPRFLMSEGMQKVGLLTFNAWALDGYVKVFWRDARPLELWPQLAILSGLALVFLAAARALAKRWETI